MTWLSMLMVLALLLLIVGGAITFIVIMVSRRQPAPPPTFQALPPSQPYGQTAYQQDAQTQQGTQQPY